MTIFLTGASGLLGNAIAKQLLDLGYSVHGTIYKTNVSLPGLIPHQVDLSNPVELGDCLLKIQPAALVNAAALSIPTDCTSNPALSQSLNVDLPVRLATIASKLKSRYIHFSTDMVFDGKRGNYSEQDTPNPTNLYAEHKLESETWIQENTTESCIIRLPLLMGNSISGTRSVHEAHWQRWKVGQITPLFEDEFRTPVSVSSIAELTAELLTKKDIQGLFHWAGTTVVNRWEMGKQIAAKLGVPKDLLLKTQARSDPRFQNRPLDLTLNISRLKALVATEPPTFEDQLDEITTL